MTGRSKSQLRRLRRQFRAKVGWLEGDRQASLEEFDIDADTDAREETEVRD